MSADWRLADVVMAHGVGSRSDLPIPFSFVVIGAAVALVASFVVLWFAWPTSRFRGDLSGRPLPPWCTRVVDSVAVRWALRGLGLLFFAFLIMTAYVAPDGYSNPTAGLVFVVFWLGIVPASLLFGPIWRELNPIRTLHLCVALAIRRPPERVGLRPLPTAVGYWPAAAGLLSFAWLELVAPDRATTAVLGAYLATYVGAQVAGVVIFGSRWLDRGDAFEVFSALVGRMSPFGRREGRVVLRWPLDNLDGLRPAPGLAAVVCVLLGTTAYDGWSGTLAWVRWTQSSSTGPVLSGTAGLLAAILMVYVAYLVAMISAGRLAGVPGRGMPGEFGHAIMPIVLGYFVAHYFTLFIIEGQRAFIAASDPFSVGANWFGTADLVVDQSIVLHPTLVATVQVCAIVAGHVLGAISAHDRAVRIFPPSRATVSQLPLMALMVIYTVIGLLLLFSS